MGWLPMKSTTTCLAGVILFCSPGLANAKTMAYWRFEEEAED